MADLVTLTIDDRQIEVPKGTLVVDAAAMLGIEIPIFAATPYWTRGLLPHVPGRNLRPRACCCRRLFGACGAGYGESRPTHSRCRMQEANLAFLLVNHPLDCPICDKGGECPLQDQTMRFGPGISQLVEPKRQKKKHYTISDTIVLDQERCVLCWRCIRYLEEWEDRPQLALFERGGATIIDVQDGKPVNVKTSGNIIDICPVAR